MAEELDKASSQWRDQLEIVGTELADVHRRLERPYDAPETGPLTIDDLSPRIQRLRHRQDQLEAAREAAQNSPQARKREVLDVGTLSSYVEDLRSLLTEGSLAE